MRASEKTFLEYFGLTPYQEEDDLLIGTVELKDYPELVFEIFTGYMKHVRGLKKTSPPHLLKAIESRDFITFEEYQEIFNYKVFSENDYRSVRELRQIERLQEEGYRVEPRTQSPPPYAMRVLNIADNEDDLNAFKRKNGNTKEDYINLVLNSGLPFVTFFFGASENLAPKRSDRQTHFHYRSDRLREKRIN